MPRSFNGSSANYLDFGSTFPIGGTMAVACWVRFNTTAAAQFIIGRAESFSPDLNPGGCWQLGLDATGKVFFAIWPSGSTNRLTATSATTLQPGRWYHVVGQQGSNVEIFLNGVRDGLTSGSRSQSDSEPLRIGQARTGGNALNGLVAHAAAWNTNLTFVEVFQLAQGALPNSVREGRLYWWVPLDAPGSAIDRSVRHLDGTENGSVPTALDPQTVDLAYGSTIFTPSAPGVIVEEIDPPFGWAGATGFAPTIEGPVNLDTVPFGLVGATGFQPAVVGELTPPVGYAEPTSLGVTLVEGSLPPFVPPSLPPTIPPGSPTGPGVPLPPLSSGGLAGIRFYQGPPWRWVVSELQDDHANLTFLDRLSFETEINYVLNRSWTARLSVPSDNAEVKTIHATDGFPFVEEGDRRLLGFRREGGDNTSGQLWVCRYAGTILQTEDTGETENARSIINAVDPWQLLYTRPMVDHLGEFPDTAGFFSFDDTQLGVIALTFLRNTILNHGPVGIDMGDTAFAGMDPLIPMPGTEFWGSDWGYNWGAEPRTKAVYENTTQIDVAYQNGLSVGEVWDQLIQTGAIDIVLTPIYDPIRRPQYTHEISIYNRLGAQATDAVFAWDKPSRNVIRINHVKDGFKRVNKIRYYENMGGPVVAGGVPFVDVPSVGRYGEYWAQQFFPGKVEQAVMAFAELQLLLRAMGMDTASFEPTNERAPFLFTEWFLGDTVPIYASNRLRQAIAGFQRMYGIKVAVDENSYERLPEVLASPEDMA